MDGDTNDHNDLNDHDDNNAYDPDVMFTARQ